MLEGHEIVTMARRQAKYNTRQHRCRIRRTNRRGKIIPYSRALVSDTKWIQLHGTKIMTATAAWHFPHLSLSMVGQGPLRLLRSMTFLLIFDRHIAHFGPFATSLASYHFHAVLQVV